MKRWMMLIIFLMGVPMAEAKDFPTVKGHCQMTKEWSIELPLEFKKRIEDGSMVLWRPGLTFWINIWGNDHSESIKEQLGHIQKTKSKEAQNEVLKENAGETRLSYEVLEANGDDPGKKDLGIYAFIITPSGYIQVGAYGDTKEDQNRAYQILSTVKFTSVQK